MEFKIVESSPEAMGAGKKPLANVVYPFDQLEVKQSFTISTAEANLGSLRAIASRKSKDGKRFVVVIHPEPHNCVEVARTA